MNLSRREMLQLSAAGVLGTSFSGWFNVLATRAAQTGQRTTKRCVLLWMDGGPSHKDTFDLRPGTEQGGPFQQIQTNVSGIQISEHFPQFAQLMNHAAIIRSMSTPEGAHARAKYNLHTGYREGQGGVVTRRSALTSRRNSAIPISRCRTSSPLVTAATAPASSARASNRSLSTMRLAASKISVPSSAPNSSTTASTCSTNSIKLSAARTQTLIPPSPIAPRISGRSL